MELITFLGQLHPVVVHLPIGFLLMAAAFDVMSYHSRYQHLRNTVSPALFAGFLSAAIACIFGYILSLSGSYDEELLERHRNAGIVLAIVSAVWWALVSAQFSRYVVVDYRFKTVFGFAVVAVLAYTGHQGGSLTHGSDYLSFAEPIKPKRAKPLTIEDALVFDDVVLPILERKCERCHRRGKRKGDLMVSTYADLMKGGENGAVIAAGSLENSELYRRITLDPEHKDFMPNDGRRPLTPEETSVIKWWIEKAQAANVKKFSSIEGHAEMLPVVAAILGMDAAMTGEVINTRQPNPDIPMSVNMSAVLKLREKGAMVRVMLHAPVMLDITLPANSGIDIDELKDDLLSVAHNVVWLNLSDNNLTTSKLIVLKEMSNLEKLRLERNPVDDDLVGILHDLKHLEALNINDTKVSDNGFLKLKEHPSLKRIFRWSSRPAVAGKP